MKDLAFHHIGIACRSVEAERPHFECLGYETEGPPFVDEQQGIRGQFLVGGGPRLELLEPAFGSATLSPWLNKGIRMYHSAYVCDILDTVGNSLRAAGAKCVRSPLPAVAFGGANIAFFMLPNRSLIEIIECGGGVDSEHTSVITPERVAD
jgi:methylmalonyl-CoA/ethylmalonyl-CoA epimerase